MLLCTPRYSVVPWIPQPSPFSKQIPNEAVSTSSPTWRVNLAADEQLFRRETLFSSPHSGGMWDKTLNGQ